MAKRTKPEDEVDEVEVDLDEAPVKSTRGPQPPRMSVTVTADLRRKLRIAAARADLEVPEWCRLVVAAAARKTVERVYGEE